ncbi:MAG: cytochrome c [Burkholderiales bacterium]|nr:cytochrome c [Burkholderiales bacterium]
MHLKHVRQELSKHMQNTTDAIALEDWEMVVKLAPQIGQHEEPPASEKLRILAYLGKDAARFRGYDHQTHEAADEMRSAALKQDGKAVINAYAKIQTNCLACHSNFRSGFQKHFYESLGSGK